MQNPKPSPLLDLVAQKKLANQQAVQQELPVVVGEPKLETIDLNKSVSYLLQSVLSLSKELDNVVIQVQNLTAEVAKSNSGVHIQGSLGIGNVTGSKWRTEHAIELLASYTKKAWTKNKLLALSVAKGWRSPEKGHKPVEHMFVTTVVSKQYPQPVIVYTEIALQHIIDNIDSCWTLATKVKL